MATALEILTAKYLEYRDRQTLDDKRICFEDTTCSIQTTIDIMQRNTNKLTFDASPEVRKG